MSGEKFEVEWFCAFCEFPAAENLPYEKCDIFSKSSS